MATVAYLKTNPNPTDADIDANLTNVVVALMSGCAARFIAPPR
jgi:hypothetical protein